MIEASWVKLLKFPDSLTVTANSMMHCSLCQPDMVLVKDMMSICIPRRGSRYVPSFSFHINIVCMDTVADCPGVLLAHGHQTFANPWEQVLGLDVIKTRWLQPCPTNPILVLVSLVEPMLFYYNYTCKAITGHMSVTVTARPWCITNKKQMQTFICSHYRSFSISRCHSESYACTSISTGWSNVCMLDCEYFLSICYSTGALTTLVEHLPCYLISYHWSACW